MADQTTPLPEPFAALAPFAEGDPAECARFAHEAMKAIPQLQQWLTETRYNAVQELRKTNSLQKVGDLLGISRQRAHQIATGATSGAWARADAETEEK